MPEGAVVEAELELAVTPELLGLGLLVAIRPVRVVAPRKRRGRRVDEARDGVGGRVERRVQVHDLPVEEEALPARLAQPVGDLAQLRGAVLGAHASGVEAVAEAAVEVGVSRHEPSREAGAREQLGERRMIGGELVRTHRSDAQVLRLTPQDRAVSRRQEAGEERAHRGHGPVRRALHLVERGAAGEDPLELGGGRTRGAEGAGALHAEGVQADDDEVARRGGPTGEQRQRREGQRAPPPPSRRGTAHASAPCRVASRRAARRAARLSSRRRQQA